VPCTILELCDPLRYSCGFCFNFVMLYVQLTLRFIALVHLPLFFCYLLEFSPLAFFNCNLTLLFIFSYFLNGYAYWINLSTLALSFESTWETLCFLLSYICLVTLMLLQFVLIASFSGCSYMYCNGLNLTNFANYFNYLN